MRFEMIKRIQNYGIFKNYTAGTDLKKFSQYNLIYGWNGSGKSTLSKIFRSISIKQAHPDYLDGTFLIEASENRTISSKKIDEFSPNIHVFNSDFIKANLNFETYKAQTILVLSEEKIEERKKYQQLQEEVKVKRASFLKLKISLQQADNELSSAYTKSAKNVKSLFENIQTSDKRLLNYNATKIKDFINLKKDKISDVSILTTQEVEKLRISVRSHEKSSITNETPKLSVEEISSILNSCSSLIEKDVVSEQIERFLEKPEINNWVSLGLKIHTENQISTCEFCGNNIKKERIEVLRKHFSQDYVNLISDLRINLRKIEKISSESDYALPKALEFSEEFQNDAQVVISKLEVQIAIWENELKKLIEILNEKIENPFQKVHFSPELYLNKYESLIRAISDLEKIVESHNTKNLNFKKEIESAQEKLELHFVSDQVKLENLQSKISFEASIRASIVAAETELKLLEAEVASLEALLINEVKGAEKFNESLSKFLGRKEISLIFDKASKGYHLIRGENSKPANNLSEGEKTAVAFVYFITKLTEGENKIRDSLIVLDDPISSFDSNHLFHAFSYIKNELEGCLQLFILTHNFQFFRLIRDWLKKKNDKTNTKSSFFIIESSAALDRQSIIKNIPDSLLKYNSEYHYLYQRLFEFKTEASLDLEKAFLVANISRKLLEGFLVFKFPRGRNDFSQLMDAGCKDNQRKEKVYRFINKYSHNQVVEVQDPDIDNMLGESDNIINEVFEIVKELDKNHFEEMSELCNGQV